MPIDELEQEYKTVEAPTFPTSQQEVATQAFESAVSPLRAGYQDRLKGTTESLAQKGIAFGGVGGEGLRDVFKEQQRVEGQIASSLGAQLGKSAMDQAFAASEAAKQRTLQKELQGAGFEFQEKEAGLGRELTREQAGLGRDLTREQAGLERELRRELPQKGFEEAQRQREFVGEQAEQERGLRREIAELGTQETERQREFQAEQSVLGREFTSQESERQREFGLSTQEAGQTFQAEQAALGRTFSREEGELQREFNLSTQEAGQLFQAQENELGRTFSREENELQREFGLNTQEAAQAFQAQESALGRTFSREENELQREFGLNTQEAAQKFEAEQSLLGRTLTINESALQRDMQKWLQESDIKFREKAQERELTARDRSAREDRRERRYATTLELALSGNVSPEDAQRELEYYLGPDAELTTNDERDLQNIAASAGLSVDDYTKIRNAIGTEQGKFIFGSHWEDELGNIVDPGTEGASEVENISMLIDDPVKSRRMSQALVEASLKAQKDLSDEQIAQQKGLIAQQGREERKTQKEGDLVGNIWRWATGEKG